MYNDNYVKVQCKKKQKKLNLKRLYYFFHFNYEKNPHNFMNG